MTGNRDKTQKQPRGEHSVLGNKKEFKKDEAHGTNPAEEAKAKDEIGHMGEASKQHKSVKDVR
ncbi:MAG TPA: hypothetical protein VD978_30870 [Azospirillum sp.]|nr:hypothetical protein [Azospirillum sp.]